MKHDGNGYEEGVGGPKWRSCGVARSIIVGFHPADPGSNPGTSTFHKRHTANVLWVCKKSIFGFLRNEYWHDIQTPSSECSVLVIE